MAKSFDNDKKQIKSKEGTSDSKVDFIKDENFYLPDDQDLDEVDPAAEFIVDEEIDDTDDDFIEEVVSSEELPEDESPSTDQKSTKKVTVLTKYTIKKKDDDKPLVTKEVNKALKHLGTDIQDRDVNTFLQINENQKEQILNGNMDIWGKTNMSVEEKKEFLDKLEDISSSEDISKANSAFVMKWLKNRNK